MCRRGLSIGALFISLASSCDTATTQPASKTALDAVVSAAANLQHSPNLTVGLSIANSATLGGTATGTGWYDFASSQGSVKLKLSNQFIEPILFAPSATYIQPPGAGSSLVPAGSWVLVDLLDPNSNGSTTAVEFIAMNPGFAAFLLANAAISASVVSDSSPAVAGATHYLVTVSPGRVAPPSPSPSATASVTAAAPTPQLAFADAAWVLSNAISSANGGSLVTPMEVWLDQSGKVKQVHVDQIGRTVGNVTFVFSAGTSPTPISTPPNNQTVDITSIANPTPGASPQETPGRDGDVS